MEALSNLPLLVKILLGVLALLAGWFLLRLLFNLGSLLLRLGCFLLVALAILWFLLRLFNIW